MDPPLDINGLPAFNDMLNFGNPVSHLHEIDPMLFDSELQYKRRRYTYPRPMASWPLAAQFAKAVDPSNDDMQFLHIRTQSMDLDPFRPALHTDQVAPIAESQSSGTMFSFTSTNSSFSPNSPLVKSAESASTKKARVAARCRHGKQNTRLKSDLRERNRIAAAKHRVKKRKAIDSLDDTLQAASNMNETLRLESRELRNQLSHWRTLALQHTCGEGGCDCMAIQQYNSDQAYKAVFGAARKDIAHFTDT